MTRRIRQMTVLGWPRGSRSSGPRAESTATGAFTVESERAVSVPSFRAEVSWAWRTRLWRVCMASSTPVEADVAAHWLVVVKRAWARRLSSPMCDHRTPRSSGIRVGYAGASASIRGGGDSPGLHQLVAPLPAELAVLPPASSTRDRRRVGLASDAAPDQLALTNARRPAVRCAADRAGLAGGATTLSWLTGRAPPCCVILARGWAARVSSWLGRRAHR